MNVSILSMALLLITAVVVATAATTQIQTAKSKFESIKSQTETCLNNDPCQKTECVGNSGCQTSTTNKSVTEIFKNTLPFQGPLNYGGHNYGDNYVGNGGHGGTSFLK